MMANTEPDSWTHGLPRNGEYYEGVVDDRLEAHKRETVTTWGTRTSSSNSKPANDCEKKAIVSTIAVKTRIYNNFSCIQDNKLYWSKNNVSFDNKPFRPTKIRKLHCQFGPHYYKPKEKNGKSPSPNNMQTRLSCNDND